MYRGFGAGYVCGGVQDDRMGYFGRRDLLRAVRHIETAVAPQRPVAGSILIRPIR
ncbi:hypothetical protein ACFCX0_00335 [Streptomyces sp. NPDC056352]|uniref:hypothetical protein n=1 Tax=Streptomyces sp. NPDC056352 TaxID=3345791 RepID=UPI0035DE16AC